MFLHGIDNPQSTIYYTLCLCVRLFITILLLLQIVCNFNAVLTKYDSVQSIFVKVFLEQGHEFVICNISYFC